MKLENEKNVCAMTSSFFQAYVLTEQKEAAAKYKERVSWRCLIIVWQGADIDRSTRSRQMRR